MNVHNKEAIIMGYRRFGNTIVARIDKDEDVLEKMKRIAMLEDVTVSYTHLTLPTMSCV